MNRITLPVELAASGSCVMKTQGGVLEARTLLSVLTGTDDSQNQGQNEAEETP